MKYELTREQLEEMVQCIVINHLDVDEAMEYALSVCSEFTCDGAEVVWPESDDRINAIAVNGNDGLHYGEAVKAGVSKRLTGRICHTRIRCYIKRINQREIRNASNYTF